MPLNAISVLSNEKSVAGRDEHTNDVYATMALYVVIREDFCAHEPRGLWRVAIGVSRRTLPLLVGKMR